MSVNQTLGRTHHHRRHHVPRGAGAVPLRRRGARGLRVHDARRHHQRHLLDGLHRRGDRDHPEPPRVSRRAAAAAPARGTAAGTRRPSSRASPAQRARVLITCRDGSRGRPLDAPSVRYTCDCSRSRAARRGPGTHRVPAGVELRAPDPRPGVLRLGRRAVRPRVRRGLPPRHAAGGPASTSGTTSSRWSRRCRACSPRAQDAPARLVWLIVVGTIPVVIVGLAASRTSRTQLRTPAVVGVTLARRGRAAAVWPSGVGTANAAGGGSRVRRGVRASACAQAAALVPGVSRSGATLTLALFLGLRRDAAARFSFLLGVPAIAAAAAHEGLKLLRRAAAARHRRSCSSSASWCRRSWAT